MSERVRTRSFKMTVRSAISFSTPTSAPRARTAMPSRNAATASPSLLYTCSALRSQSFWIMRITSSGVGALCRCFIGFSLWFFLLLLALYFRPGFELPDGIALHRHLDMGVEGIDFLARGVAHEGHPHVLHDAGFHEPGVERVAKIMEAEIADARPPDCRLPRRLDPLDRTAFEGENQADGFLTGKPYEKLRESRGERDFAGLPARSFRVSDLEHATVEVDVLHALGEQFSAAHPAIERRDDDRREMRRGRRDELRFFLHVHHGSRFP